MLMTILGLVDIVLGGVLAASPWFSYSGIAIVGALGIIGIIKGLYSILAAAGGGFYWDLPGWLDFVVGALLILTTVGIKFPFFLYVGAIIAIFGLYSVAMDLVGD